MFNEWRIRLLPVATAGGCLARSVLSCSRREVRLGPAAVALCFAECRSGAVAPEAGEAAARWGTALSAEPSRPCSSHRGSAGRLGLRATARLLFFLSSAPGRLARYGCRSRPCRRPPRDPRPLRAIRHLLPLPLPTTTGVASASLGTVEKLRRRGGTRRSGLGASSPSASHTALDGSSAHASECASRRGKALAAQRLSRLRPLFHPPAALSPSPSAAAIERRRFLHVRGVQRPPAPPLLLRHQPPDVTLHASATAPRHTALDHAVTSQPASASMRAHTGHVCGPRPRPESTPLPPPSPAAPVFGSGIAR